MDLVKYWKEGKTTSSRDVQRLDFCFFSEFWRGKVSYLNKSAEVNNPKSFTFPSHNSRLRIFKTREFCWSKQYEFIAMPYEYPNMAWWLCHGAWCDVSVAFCTTELGNPATTAHVLYKQRETARLNLRAAVLPTRRKTFRVQVLLRNDPFGDLHSQLNVVFFPWLLNLQTQGKIPKWLDLFIWRVFFFNLGFQSLYLRKVAVSFPGLVKLHLYELRRHPTYRLEVNEWSIKYCSRIV
jgi:hypothetical protein